MEQFKIELIAELQFILKLAEDVLVLYAEYYSNLDSAIKSDMSEHKVALATLDMFTAICSKTKDRIDDFENFFGNLGSESDVENFVGEITLSKEILNLYKSELNNNEQQN